jgi:tetratricopeptide (TPR) repeat protein
MSPSEQVLSLRRAGQHEEACSLAASLAARYPADAELQFQAACVHDFLGREAQAVPFYLAGLSGVLSDEHLRSAYLGLGSTYRALGQYPAAERTLREGLARFPDALELQAFLAMALHNLGQSRQAVELLLNVLARSSADPHIQSYRKAILFYAQDLEKSWADADSNTPARHHNTYL